MPTIYEIIISMIALIICTVTDIKSKSIIPLVPLLLIVAGLFTPNKDYLANFYCLLIGFLPIFLVNRFGNGGDGDALVCGALGFSMPVNFGAKVFLLTGVLYFIVLLVVVIIKKDKKLQLPYMPFLTLSYIIVLVLHMSGGLLS